METKTTFKDGNFAYPLTSRLAAEISNLAGLHVAGGEITGVMRAIGEISNAQSFKPIIIAPELTNGD